jgi:glycosyltransferase involved in cell wall biosynthesis
LNIVLIGPSWPFKGGIAYHTTLLYRALRRNHQVEFITFKRQYPAWLYPGEGDKDEDNTTLREDQARPLIDSLNPISLIRTAQAIEHFDPELLLVPWWVAFWAPHFLLLIRSVRRRCPNCRVVFVCHNVTAHDSGILSRRLTQVTLAQGDAFLVQSGRDRECLLELLPDAMVEQVEHPSYDLFPGEQFDRVAARQQLQLVGNVALFFGFVRPYKGLDILLDALPATLEQIDLQVLIVGEFWRGADHYRQSLERLGVGDHVHIVDAYVPHDEVARWFAATDVVLLPYLEATGSGVLKLAYGCGRCAIGSKVGSLGEAIIDGESGLLVPPGDAGALAEALIRFFKDGLRDPFEADVRRRRQEYSWQALVDAVQRLGAPR